MKLQNVLLNINPVNLLDQKNSKKKKEINNSFIFQNQAVQSRILNTKIRHNLKSFKHEHFLYLRLLVSKEINNCHFNCPAGFKPDIYRMPTVKINMSPTFAKIKHDNIQK